MFNIGAMKVSLFLFACTFSITNGRRSFGDEEQEWGYFTVREYVHIFWWLHYTTAADVNGNYHEKPLVLWMQGGPGQSSTGYGNFMELGPLDTNLKPRNNTWIKNYNVLFIDNPVGAGFSYAEANEYYNRMNAEIAADLLTVMKDFYNMFPKFADTPTYIVSESYGGKVTVEFANVWYNAQINSEIKSNLKGVALGSPWISPLHSVMEYAPTLLYMGMIDKSGYDNILRESILLKKTIENNEWLEATEQLNYVEETIYNETDKVDIFNVITKTKSNGIHNEPASIYGDYMNRINKLDYFMNTVVKQKLNLNVFWGHMSGVVYKILKEDFLKPAMDQVESLLDQTDIKVYIFNGQLDIAVNTVGTEKWIEELNWKNINNWKKAKRRPMIIDGTIEGYTKQYGKLKMIWINRAGHMATVDNPLAVSEILKDLTKGSL